MQFKDVPGNNSAKRRLVSTIKENRVSHAQLFFGPQGSGKLALAIAYAQYINCTDRGENDSCGKCPSCIKYQKLIHPDLHFIYPVASSKGVKNPLSKLFVGHWRSFLDENDYIVSLTDWYKKIEIENRQAIINTDDANEIIKTLSYTSYESEYKVMIIWMPEKFYYAAIPKILKILEEPPEKTLFLLVTEDREKILKTILSRTQLVKVNRLKDSEIIDYLVTHFDIDNVEAERIAFLSEGNLYAAKYIVENGDNENNNFLLYRDWMRLCYKYDVVGFYNFVTQVSKMGRERQKSFLNYALKSFVQSIRINFNEPKDIPLQGEELDFIKKFSPFVNTANIVQLNEEINKAIFHIERNANPSILFMDLSLQVARLIRMKPEIK